MVKISVFGHSPDAFSNVTSLTYIIENVIAIIKRQHGKEHDFMFLLNCEPGASQLFCGVLMENNLPYEVFLSTTPEQVSQYWSEKQQICFMSQLEKSNAINICGENNSHENCIIRDKKLIDASQWVLVFWNGKHQGLTYSAIEYAIKNNKLVYNALDSVKLVDSSALKMREWIDDEKVF